MYAFLTPQIALFALYQVGNHKLQAAFKKNKRKASLRVSIAGCVSGW